MTQENQNPTPEQENPAADTAANEAAATESPAVKSPEQEISELNQKISELQDNFLRAKAEGENIRRRAVEDIS